MDAVRKILAEAQEAAQEQDHEGQRWKAEAKEMPQELQCQSKLKADCERVCLEQQRETEMLRAKLEEQRKEVVSDALKMSEYFEDAIEAQRTQQRSAANVLKEELEEARVVNAELKVELEEANVLGAESEETVELWLTEARWANIHKYKRIAAALKEQQSKGPLGETWTPDPDAPHMVEAKLYKGTVSKALAANLYKVSKARIRIGKADDLVDMKGIGMQTKSIKFEAEMEAYAWKASCCRLRQELVEAQEQAQAFKHEEAQMRIHFGFAEEFEEIAQEWELLGDS